MPADGVPGCGGALPTLIEWAGAHPTRHLPDVGVALRALTLHGLPQRVRDALPLRDVQMHSGAGPALQATFDTPRGSVVLTS